MLKSKPARWCMNGAARASVVIAARFESAMQDDPKATGSDTVLVEAATVSPAAAAPPHEIIVVGGGAGGIELATRLGDTLGKRGRARVTLVDKTRTHLWKPLLHTVAAGSMDPSEVERNYLAQAHLHHFNYRFGEMIGLDRSRQLIHVGATFDEEGREITPTRSFRYDTLVIAVGSVTNDFGTPGVASHAIPLDTTQQAVRFNRRLVNALIHAHAQHGPVRAGQLHVAIIGAGATGTELAAELHRTAREVIAHGLDRIDPQRDLRIILIEAAERILPALPERVSDASLALLRELGVDVRTGARVSEVIPQGVRLANGDFIDSELVVWAAGVKAPEFLRNLDGLETNRINQIVVLPTLQTTGDPNIFAMGDCAEAPREGFDAPVPPRAQAAHQQATHLAKQFRRRLDGKPLEPYIYRDFGSLVSFGNYSTVGNLMGFLIGRNFFIEGYFAKLMYRSLHFMHERALYGFWKASVRWLAHGLTHQTGPTVKLH
jgi:NADH dehydrogenase